MSFFTTMYHKILDASIVFSFDRSGFLRHQQQFDATELDVPCHNKNYLITGSNSGLGKATACTIAQKGGNVYLLCRNKQKAEQAQKEIIDASGNHNVHIELIDMSDLISVRACAQRLKKIPIHVLIHNAGILPKERWTSPQGHEGTFATNLLGAQLLTILLYPILEKTPQSSIIWVSSGGMYSTRLNTSLLIDPKSPFDGVQAYAQTKRAQVVLNRMWSKKGSVASFCMHPGWAATPGVAQSLPRFQKMMNERLRTSQQGADTIIWLAMRASEQQDTGTLWFDRKKVSEHFLPWTASTHAEEQRLWDTLQELLVSYIDEDLRGS